jgi:hypothetical protein
MISTSSLFFKSCIICMSHETNAFFAHKRRKSQARRKWVEDLAGQIQGMIFSFIYGVGTSFTIILSCSPSLSYLILLPS